MANLFFDTEFTGLHKDTTLISIGIVDEDNNTFYAEFTDYNKSQVNDWIKTNVISKLQYGGKYTYGKCDRNISMSGNKTDVNIALFDWLSKYDEIQFVSDVCHYDFVLLIDLISNGGTAFDIPNTISPACHDINQDIANYYNIKEWEAFNINRERIASIYDENAKHNALWDAKIIKAIYERITN